MRLCFMLVLAAFTISTAAIAADSTDRTAPYDRNPACMDRNTDASTGNCVVKDEGRPRRTYPPNQSSTGVVYAPAPAGSTAVPSTARKTNPAAGK